MISYSDSERLTYFDFQFSTINEDRVILTCPPPNTKDPNLLRSFKGIHAANNELNAGNVVPKLIKSVSKTTT